MAGQESPDAYSRVYKASLKTRIVLKQALSSELISDPQVLYMLKQIDGILREKEYPFKKPVMINDIPRFKDGKRIYKAGNFSGCLPDEKAVTRTGIVGICPAGLLHPELPSFLLHEMVHVIQQRDRPNEPPSEARECEADMVRIVAFEAAFHANPTEVDHSWFEPDRSYLRKWKCPEKFAEFKLFQQRLIKIRSQRETHLCSPTLVSAKDNRSLREIRLNPGNSSTPPTATYVFRDPANPPEISKCKSYEPQSFYCDYDSNFYVEYNLTDQFECQSLGVFPKHLVDP